MHHISTEAGGAPKNEDDHDPNVEEEDGKITEGPLWIKLKIPKSGHHHRELSKESPFPFPHHPLPSPLDEKGLIKGSKQKEEDVDDLDPQEEEKEKRICSVCKKGFSSGKALGGHVRIHVQAHHHHNHNHNHHNKQQPLQSCHHPNKKIKNATPPASASAAAAITHHPSSKLEGDDVHNQRRNVCMVCGKNFKSEKSLFGHMRCHPDRPWRGIHPPSGYSSYLYHPAAAEEEEEEPPIHNHNNKNSSSSTLSSDALLRNNRHHHHHHRQQFDLQIIDSAATTNMVVDLSRALRGVGCSKTDRRGRKQVITTTTTTNPDSLAAATAANPSVSGSSSRSCGWELEEEEEGAANELMCLSHHHHHHHHHAHPNQFLNHHQEEEEEAAAAAAAVAVAVAEATNSANSLTNEVVVKMETNNGSSSSSSKRMIRSLIDHELEQPDDDDERKNKKMKESKNKKKKKRKKRRQVKIRDLGTVVIRDGGIGANIINIPPPPTSTAIGADGDDEMNAALLLPAERFKCSTCSKTFPTHQALGGHRSSHNKLLLKHNPIPHHQASKEEEEEEEEEEGPLVEQEEEDVKKKKKKNKHEIAAEEYDHNWETGREDEYYYWESAQHLCRICNKSFSTGQALGGHMRCHYLPTELPTTTTVATPPSHLPPPPPINTWTSTSLSSQSHTGDGGGGKLVLNFDLNELPAFDEEEEGEEGMCE